jgi:two-component system, NtrC family, nitrogen regulation response regulator NtrX
MPSLLYVDDEETIGRAVTRWFERRGHTVHVARSVDEAKRVLLVHSPDAIFIDVWLGSESGFELLSWIEDVRAPLANRVTFVTGELAEAVERGDRVFQTLGRPVLQKPFDLSQLEAHTNEYTAAQQASDT